MKRTLAIGLLAALAAMACAQDTMQNNAPSTGQQHPRAKIYTIAVNVQSRDPRVKLMIGDLNRDAAEIVERAAANTHAIIVTGTKAEAAEQARRRNADYLVTIDFSPHSTVSVPLGPAADRSRDPEVFGSPDANAQGEMFLAWNVEPFQGNKVRLHDSRYVQKMEYPLPNVAVAPNWLADIAQESVRSAAAEAMRKLKLKKGLDLKLDVVGIHGN